MGSFSIWHWIIVLGFAGAVVWVVRLLLRSAGSAANEVANTFKFRTVVFIILALIIPMWLITLPLFLYLAYRSYAAGTPQSNTPEQPQSRPSTSTANVAGEIETLHRLVASGALSEAEFQIQKARLLGTDSAA